MIKSELIEDELRRQSKKESRIRRAVITVIIVYLAIAILVILCKSVFRITKVYGSSMEDTYFEGDYLLVRANGQSRNGDVVVVLSDEGVLLKRQFAYEGETVDFKEDGTVLVDGVEVFDEYASDHGQGLCDVNFPHVVEEGSIFLLGDHRSVSIDSRSTIIGDVERERVVGRVLFRIWPLVR